MPIAKTAFVDESLRVCDGLYVLAAVIVADDNFEHHRQALRALLYRGQRRLHWRDESTRHRNQIIGAVRRLPHTGAVVIATGMAPKRQERARRNAREGFLHPPVGRHSSWIPNITPDGYIERSLDLTEIPWRCS